MSPNLPPEIVAKILVKGGLYTQKRKFEEISTEISTSRALHEYADMAQKEEERVWEPVIDWIRGGLNRLHSTMQSTGRPRNSFLPHGGTPVPYKLLACWPRCHVHEEDDEYRVMEAYFLTQETCEQIAAGNKYSFETPVLDVLDLVVFYNGALPPRVTAVELKVTETKYKSEHADGDLNDTHGRSLSIILRYDGGGYANNHLCVEFSVEEARCPDTFQLSFSGMHNGSKRLARVIDAYQHDVVLLLRGLLTMEPAPRIPLIVWDSTARTLLKAHGFNCLGVKCNNV